MPRKIPWNVPCIICGITNAQNNGNITTGLIYLDPESEDLHEILNTSSTGLNKLTEKELCPGSDVLDKINASLR